MKQKHTQTRLRKGEQSIFRIMEMGQRNIIFDMFFTLLFNMAAIPSYIVTVFMRKRFGERGFTSSIAILTFIILVAFYIVLGRSGIRVLGIFWIPFLCVFLVRAIKHRLEITKYGSSYNFERYSYSDGEILPQLHDLLGKEILGITINKYYLYTLVEPAIPVFIGLVIMIIPLTGAIGHLILLGGLCLGFRNFLKAKLARDYVLDMIDEQIANKWKYDVIMEEKPKTETQGLSLPIELPQEKSLRTDILNAINGSHQNGDIWDNPSGTLAVE